MNTFKLYGLKTFALLSILLQLINYDVCAQELRKPEDVVKDVLTVNLEKCLNIALENNRQRRVSQSAIEIAEAQHKQALSAYWPQLKLEVSATRMDEDMNFIFPQETSSYGIDMGLGPMFALPLTRFSIPWSSSIPRLGSNSGLLPCHRR
jgi:hypothetical protein